MEWEPGDPVHDEEHHTGVSRNMFQIIEEFHDIVPSCDICESYRTASRGVTWERVMSNGN